MHLENLMLLEQQCAETSSTITDLFMVIKVRAQGGKHDSRERHAAGHPLRADGSRHGWQPLPRPCYARVGGVSSVPVAAHSTRDFGDKDSAVCRRFQLRSVVSTVSALLKRTLPTSPPRISSSRDRAILSTLPHQLPSGIVAEPSLFPGLPDFRRAGSTEYLGSTESGGTLSTLVLRHSACFGARVLILSGTQ